MGWAWVSLGTMLVTNVAALVTEFAGVSGAAQIFGLPSTPLVIAAAALLGLVILTASYKRAERFALATLHAGAAVHPGGLRGAPVHARRDRAGDLRQPAARESGLPAADRFEHRRRHHAVDDLLPAERGRGQGPDRERHRLRARRYGDRIGADAGDHDRDHRHDRRHALRAPHPSQQRRRGRPRVAAARRPVRRHRLRRGADRRVHARRVRRRACNGVGIRRGVRLALLAQRRPARRRASSRSISVASSSRRRSCSYRGFRSSR